MRDAEAINTATLTHTEDPMTDTQPKDKSDSKAKPAQGTLDTGTKYRDRPSDDGKYGDADAQPRPGAAREDAAGT
jgi:hypothetical protein